MLIHMSVCRLHWSQNIIFPTKIHTGDPCAANQEAWLGGKTLLGFLGNLISKAEEECLTPDPLGLHRDPDCSQVSKPECFADKCVFMNCENGGCDGSFSTPTESHLLA